MDQEKTFSGIMKKADRAVRFFCVLAPSFGFAFAEEIPDSWIKEAKEASRDRSAQLPVPQYERELVARIYEKIVSAPDEAFADYQSRIPATGVEYEMVAVKGGRFLMGSPPEEEHRNLDEGPQRKVKISPFWIGRFEVSWDQFRPFAEQHSKRPSNRNGSPRDPEETSDLVDWVSAPTEPYMQTDMGMGYDGFPAIGMTQHAASKFCQWLSIQTGHFYRLPTEAEWEYACRAGTTGPFHCPGVHLEKYAVIDPEQIRTSYEKVGSRKPNPWGIHDMHGNVVEWCLDAYSPTLSDLPAVDPWRRATQRFGRVVRGGSWYDTSEYCRSAARLCSNENWIMQDPQIPKSLWWQTDASWLGFRLVRPLEIPDRDTMFEMWNSGGVHPQPGDRKFELR